jgi:hypothetical protein
VDCGRLAPSGHVASGCSSPCVGECEAADLAVASHRGRRDPPAMTVVLPVPAEPASTEKGFWRRRLVFSALRQHGELRSSDVSKADGSCLNDHLLIGACEMCGI